MEAIAKVPIVLVIACLWASVIATTITFPLDFWIFTILGSYRFGMWNFCYDQPNGVVVCQSWFNNFNLFGMTDDNGLAAYYKAFQGLQCGFLGLTALTLMSILMKLACCSNFVFLFVVDAIFLILAVGSATASLVIYGVKIYNPSIHTLGWCFWVSVGSGGILLFGLLFLTIYIIIIGTRKQRSKDYLKSTTGSNLEYDNTSYGNYTPNNRNQPPAFNRDWIRESAGNNRHQNRNQSQLYNNQMKVSRSQV